MRRLTLLFAAAVATATAAHAPEPTAEEIGSVQVFLTADQALDLAFPGAVRFERRARALSDSLRADVARLTGRPLAADSLAVYVARAPDEALLGYAVVDDEVGKYRPITYLVATDPDLRVRQVAILVYRESRGAEVRRERFLRQYRGKGPDDPIAIHRDITGITGATLSVRALSVGVRRALLLLAATAPHG